MKKICVVLGCALLLCGCTESKIVTPTQPANLAPDMNVYSKGIEINWDQVKEDWNDAFADPSVYPLAHSLDYLRDDDAETLDIYIYVQPGTTEEEASEYATEAIKGLNDAVYMQDFSFTQSGADYYGSFVSIYDVNVVVAPYDTKEDQSTWIINDKIEAFEYKEVGSESAAEDLDDEDSADEELEEIDG